MMTKEVNPHFEDFIFDWESKFYFLVGGYGSSKSYHVALKIVLKLLSEKRTALVVRETFASLKDSCFSLFAEIIDDMDLYSIVSPSVSPMTLKFLNGSKIIFKGMDKPEKLKSINNITIVWLEECSEIKYSGFKELLGRLRHPSLSLHFILSTNPVDKGNWTYKHFFKDDLNGRTTLDDELLYEKRIARTSETYYHHSIGDDNLFLPKDYLTTLDEMKLYDPDLYRIARFGRFGTNGTKVLPQFCIAPHYEVISAIQSLNHKRVGMDFGFEESYNAVVRIAIDGLTKTLYIYWEYYKNRMTDDKTAIELDEFKQTKEIIRADCAEPKTIAYFCQQGFKMIRAKKFPGSRLANIKKVKRFKHIICSESCVNTIRELEYLTYKKDKNGEIISDDFNIDPHTFSAIWYALDGYEVADLKARTNHSGRGKRYT